MVSFTVLYPITATHSLWNKTSWNTHSNAFGDELTASLGETDLTEFSGCFFCLCWEMTVCKKGRFVGKDHVWRCASTKKILREKPLVWQNIILRKFVSESSSLNLSSHDSMLPCPTEAAILKSRVAESHTYFPKSIHPGRATQWLQY